MLAPDYSPETDRALAAEFGAEARIAHDIASYQPALRGDLVAAHVYAMLARDLATKAAHFGRRALEATA